MSLPLEKTMVLDLAGQYPGSYCSMLLADMGAEVIKIEKPPLGDPARYTPHFYLSLNRNKKSLGLDLKSPEGKEVFYRLLKEVDVILEGFRPGVAKRLGIDYNSVKKINPDIIYCSISGYGQRGAYKRLPGHDINYQGFSGMLSLLKDSKGEPAYPSLALSDISSGMFAGMAIIAALLGREKYGISQYIDISMLDCLLSFMATIYGRYLLEGKAIPQRKEPGYGIFKTKDQKYITIGIAYEDWFWENLCQVLGLKEIAKAKRAERSKNREKYILMLKKKLLAKRRDEWVKIFLKAELPCAPLYSLDEAVKDSHIQQRRVFSQKQIASPIRFSKTYHRMHSPPPLLGEHTIEVLKKLGYSDKKIKKLREEKVI